MTGESGYPKLSQIIPNYPKNAPLLTSPMVYSRRLTRRSRRRKESFLETVTTGYHTDSVPTGDSRVGIWTEGSRIGVPSETVGLQLVRSPPTDRRCAGAFVILQGRMTRLSQVDPVSYLGYAWYGLSTHQRRL